MQSLPEHRQNPDLLRGTEYTYEWYSQQNDHSLMEPVFTREHIDQLYEIADLVEQGEMPIEVLIAYMNPYFQGEVLFFEHLETFGRFFDQPAASIGDRRLTPEINLQYRSEIEDWRLKFRQFALTAPEGEHFNLALFGSYMNAVNRYLDALEATYDPEDMLAIFIFKREEILQMLSTGTGPNEQAFDLDALSYLEGLLETYNKTISRLTRHKRLLTYTPEG